MRISYLKPRAGIALVTVLVAMFAVSVVAVGGMYMASTSIVVTRYDEARSILAAVADGGLEVGRAHINGDKSIYPDQGYITLEQDVRPVDADGNYVEDVRRTVYVGPSGLTTGQYGVFGSIVSVAEATDGTQVIRRREVYQESFAKFAYFTNAEGNIWFGGGDQIFGPLHSNDRIQIHSTGATFHGPVKTAQYVRYPDNGTFKQGYTEYAATIPMPQTADLTDLQTYATEGSTSFTSSDESDAGDATMRIEFLSMDADADGVDEGYIMVYSSSDPSWVVAERPGTDILDSPNCGHWNDATGLFAQVTEYGTRQARSDSLKDGSGRCYLGGADPLAADDDFDATDGRGQWLQWPHNVHANVQAHAKANSGEYVFPINRAYNSTFKGVIFVDGDVAISGVVRGQITLAATGNIVIADDIVYDTDPGNGTCTDMLGLFAGGDVIIADNLLNAPTRIPRFYYDWNGNLQESSGSYYTMDETTGEFIHAVVLALDQFTVENYSSGSDSAEPCEGTTNGRGCIYLTGGIVQAQRGPVGLTSGEGYIKRYSYDTCAFTNQPPYYPTTGHFVKGRYFEIDPTGFNVADLWAQLTP